MQTCNACNRQCQPHQNRRPFTSARENQSWFRRARWLQLTLENQPQSWQCIQACEQSREVNRTQNAQKRNWPASVEWVDGSRQSRKCLSKLRLANWTCGTSYALIPCRVTSLMAQRERSVTDLCKKRLTTNETARNFVVISSYNRYFSTKAVILRSIERVSQACLVVINPHILLL